MKLFISLLIVFFIFNLTVSAQNDSILFPRKIHKQLFIPGLGLLYAGGMYGLYHAWYKDYNTGSFHFFNDNKEWLQMDKLGHLTTSYQIGAFGYHSFKYFGYSEKQALWLGGSLGSIFLTGIEIFDGFSDGWGFSWGDAGANFVGSALFISQQHFWQEQKIKLKFSFMPSKLAPYRPDLLGRNLSEQILKDYNGQKYWLSFNMNHFGGYLKKIPPWLCVSFGYGATGMVGGESNYWIESGVVNNYLHLNRERRYFLSFDIDLAKIKTKSSALNLLTSVFGFIKIPAPTVELRENGFLKFHPIYF